MRPTGILFDLDDTIISYTQVAEPIWRQICMEYSKKTDLFGSDNLFNAIRDVSNWYWSDEERHRIGRSDLNKARRHILETVFDRLSISDKTLAWEIADTFSIRREEEVFLFKGAKETLEYFHSKGISLALITNGESVKQRNKIERFGLEKYFQIIIIEGEVGFGKPDERVYTCVLNDLNLEPAQVWSVGDNLEWDVGGPQKLGIFGIWNDYAGKGLSDDSQVVPDRIIKNIDELIKVGKI